MIYDGECEVCSAPDSKVRDNGNTFCDVCAEIAEQEPDHEFFFNREVTA